MSSRRYRRATAGDLTLIERLRDSGHTLRQTAAELSRRDPAGPPWTPWQVWYYRHRETLRQRKLASLFGGECPASPSQARRNERRRYQVQQGWWFLLPRAQGRREQPQPGFELPRVLVDVLTLLRDRGPLTRRQIAAALGRHPLLNVHGGDRTAIVQLRLLGFIILDAETLTYRLTPHLEKSLRAEKLCV